MIDLKRARQALKRAAPIIGGRVTRITGTTLEALLPHAQTGSVYRVAAGPGRPGVLAEVIGFRENETILAPFQDPRGISPGDPVMPEGFTDAQRISDAFLGRVVGPLGDPLDDGPEIHGGHPVPLYRAAPNPLSKRPIELPMLTGLSVIDAMATCGRGQRMGIFAGAGVGKSTLMGMLARFCESDVNVIALVGERGREVPEFIRNDLGEEGLARSVLVVATSDQSPILRVRAALLATTIAEFFRDRGKDVLLMMDSLTRLAHAQREIGLAAGEPPTTRGYPPSVFAVLPRVLERAGNADTEGTLTAFYTVLVDQDDMTDPIADAVRSILDGHLLLSRRIAEAGRYPAIDIAASLSRVATALIDGPHAGLARRVREVLSAYDEVRDMIRAGAYEQGTDPHIDEVVQLYPKLTDYFKQSRQERRSLEATLGGLQTLLGPQS